MSLKIIKCCPGGPGASAKWSIHCSDSTGEHGLITITHYTHAKKLDYKTCMNYNKLSVKEGAIKNVSYIRHKDFLLLLLRPPPSRSGYPPPEI